MVQSNLDLSNSIFPFLNRELFDLRNIYELNHLITCPKKMPYVGEFARSVKRVQADYVQGWQQSMVSLKTSLIVLTTLLVIASCE